MDNALSVALATPVEADYAWFRYSKYGLPFVLLNLVLAVILFWLTVWWGNFTLWEMLNGTPRMYEVRCSRCR